MANHRLVKYTPMHKDNELLSLSEVPLFKSLSADELARVLKTYKILNAPAGALVLTEGQIGEEFYVILRGQVEIVRALGTPEESHLGLRHPGEFIGEIGLLNQSAPRTATARVVQDVSLLTVTYSAFNELLESHPELTYELASVLGERLSSALTETIRNLHDRNEKLQRAYIELKDAQKKIIEKEKLEHSLEEARKIQYSILPMRVPQVNGFEIGALMKPAQAVGGDFFGVYPLDAENLALIVGDVSDKGMPSAIFMAQCHALLRAFIQSDLSTTDVLNRVNNLLIEMNSQGLFVTIIYGILNTPSGEFRYTRAGHEVPLIVNADGTSNFIEVGKGMPLGIFPDPILEERILTIPRGGFMLLYSDGIADDKNGDGLRFGNPGLQRVTAQFALSSSAQETCESIFAAITDYQSGTPQFDDITLLAVRRFT